MDAKGFAAFIEKCIGLLNFVIEECQRAKASMVEMREATTEFEKLLPRQRIFQYWRKHWPQGKYPVVEEWSKIRAELDGGGLVLVRVGQSEAASFWIRLTSLTEWKDGLPGNGTFIPEHERDDYPQQTLCPKHGKTPSNAIWECVIHATRTGA